jgi:G3E family GTPase
VTLVDAVNAPGQLTQFSEPLKQVALADRLVVTKTDLISEQKLATLTGRLREINPRVPLRVAMNGEIELGFLVDVGLRRTHADLEEVERWLGEDYEDEHGHGHRHDESVQSFALRFAQPLPWSAFAQCMEVLTALRGPDLLRVKGLVNVEGKSGPMVVQGVQHLFHPPLELAAWPSADRSTRLVFITRGIPRQVVADLFAAIGAVTTRATGAKVN